MVLDDEAMENSGLVEQDVPPLISARRTLVTMTVEKARGHDDRYRKIPDGARYRAVAPPLSRWLINCVIGWVFVVLSLGSIERRIAIRLSATNSVAACEGAQAPDSLWHWLEH